MRLVPPKRRALAVDRDDDAEAAAWARGLHKKRRGLAITILGNLAMLFVLLGIPFLRGQSRARRTFQKHAVFVSCLLGPKAREPVGIGASRDEPELFAARLLAHEAGWPARCNAKLAQIAPESAIFVLPSVKSAEDTVREAARVVGVELRAIAHHQPGEPVPDRPLRALAQLRDTLRAQSEAANLLDTPVHATLERNAPLSMPRTAQLPIYAGPDAALELWGDDHALYATAFDRTGVSYLEVEAGRPLRRARLTRPAALRGVLRAREARLLVWATPEARCRERANGCYGKTTSLARLPVPFFEIPPARLVSAHMAGRVDRSLAFLHGVLELAAANEAGGVSLESLLLAPETVFDASLPALVPVARSSASYDDLLLSAGSTRTFALATQHDDAQGTLLLASVEGAKPLAQLPGGSAPWVVACTQEDVLDFATGNGHTLVLGRLHGETPEVFAPLALPTRDVVHTDVPARDRVALLCTSQGPFALVHGPDGALTGVLCRSGSACRTFRVAQTAHAYAMVGTTKGALVAWAGDQERPQIHVADLDFEAGTVSRARVPAACWVRSRGLCGPPLLARLGTRIVLAGREGADMSLLESADEGASWSTPPVY